jgi:hypothetical protein
VVSTSTRRLSLTIPPFAAVHNAQLFEISVAEAAARKMAEGLELQRDPDRIEINRFECY